MEFAYFSTTDSAEWEQWHGRNIEVSNDSLGLETEPKINYTNLRLEAIDISIDQEGNVLMLDEGGNIHQHHRDEDETKELWANGTGATIQDPRALCVFGDRIYVVDGSSGDLVVVSRRDETVAGEVTARLDDPIDIIRSNQRVYILDAGTETISGRVLTLRRNGMLETVIRGLDSPMDITADSAHLYVVEQSEDTTVIRIHDVEHVDSPSVIPTSRTVDELKVPGADEPVIPIRIEVLTDQELVVVGRAVSESQLSIYHYALDQDTGTLTRRDSFPLSCSKLLTGPRDQNRRYPKYYAIAGQRNHVYIIDERQTNRRNPHDERYSAQAFRRFDSGTIDTGWNRLTLAFESFPANTQVATSYYATNDRTDGGGVETLDAVPETHAEKLQEAGVDSVWELLETEPGRVASIVGDSSTDRVEQWREAAVERIDEGDWISASSANQRDILLEDIDGQYLHVKIELVGEIDSSPQIGSFRTYLPKRSYLRYLPEQFQTTSTKSQFLERYLSIFESEFVDIEEKIERLTQQFDPEGVPNEFLSWLSSWLAIEYSDEWPAGAKREFLVNAPTLFKMRGTKEGMERTLRLYLRHVDRPDTSWMAQWRKERIDTRRSDGKLTDDEVGRALREIDETTSGYPEGHLLFFFEHLDLDDTDSEEVRRPFTMHMEGSRSFVVFIGPFVTEDHRKAVERIVGVERPAHTHGRVVEMRQELKLEGSSFLGVNSTLTTREFVLGRSTLGGDTVLKERGSLA